MMIYRGEVDAYARAALDRECAELARAVAGRNERLNAAAFALGQFVGANRLTQSEVEQGLFDAAVANHYVAKDGPAAARATIRSGIEKGSLEPRVNGSGPQRSEAFSRARSAASTPAVVDAGALPSWTPPNEKGWPRFEAIGKDEPPALRDELPGRRHLYRRDGEPVRMKIKRQGGGFVDCYRVRRPDTGEIGWQAKRPTGFEPVPYVASINPFDPELLGDTIFVPEGEKDVDTLAANGLAALSFGGASDRPDGCEKWIAGRDVVIPADNDDQGRRHAQKLAAIFATVAASVKIVDFPELPVKGDVSDWLGKHGGTVEELWRRVDDAKPISARSAAIKGVVAAADGFELKWHGEADDAPLKEWLVDKMLPKVGKALIVGQWGTYKTFIALALAASVMSKTQFAGRRVDLQGGTLFMAAEGQDEVRVRLAALAIDKITPLAEQEGSVRVNPAAMPFVWVEKCPQLTADDALAKLREIVAGAATGMRERHGLPLAMIIIDTLMPAAVFRDANDASETQRVMTVLTAISLEFRLLVVAVDHFGKDVSTGTRNSSVKEDAVDAVLAALAERDLAGNVTNPRLAVRKVRGAPTGQQVPFKTRSVVVAEDLGFDAVTTLVVDWCAVAPNAGAADVRKRWPKKLMIFKRALDSTLASSGQKARPFIDLAEVVAVDREAVRGEFLKICPGDTLKLKGQQFRRCEQNAVAESLMGSRVVDAITLFWPVVL